jgi:hypothetical protein
MVRIALTLLLLMIGKAQAETVCIKYGDCIEIDSFECHSVTRSSFIHRVCYRPDLRYMVVRLNSTYYHYCEIGQQVVSQFIAAGSMGRFYNQNIKSSSNGGLYDCRNHPVPEL